MTPPSELNVHHGHLCAAQVRGHSHRRDRQSHGAIQAQLTPKYSASTIKHVRSKIVEVFEEAVEQEFVNRSPASKTKIPATARKRHQPILTEEQLINIIDKMSDTCDRAIFLTGTFCAIRTREVFGLPWKNFHESREEEQSYFLVDKIAYRGQRHQRTKAESS